MGDPDSGVRDGEAQRGRSVGIDLGRRVGAGDRDDDLAALGGLERMAGQVGQDLAGPARVATYERRQTGVDDADELEALGMGALGEQVEDLLDDRPRREVDDLELELPRLVLREVEDVVDDLEERLAGRPDGVGEIALLDRQIRVEQETGHPDDAIHRRPDLVAHRGQEVALRAGCLGRDAGELMLMGGDDLQLAVRAGDPTQADGAEDDHQDQERPDRDDQVQAAAIDIGVQLANGADDRDDPVGSVDQGEARSVLDPLVVERDVAARAGEHLGDRMLPGRRARCRRIGERSGVIVVRQALRSPERRELGPRQEVPGAVQEKAVAGPTERDAIELFDEAGDRNLEVEDPGVEAACEDDRRGDADDPASRIG